MSGHGLVFRCERKVFKTAKGIGLSVKMNLLKRHSCSCKKCTDYMGFIESQIQEGCLTFDGCDDGFAYRAVFKGSEPLPEYYYEGCDVNEGWELVIGV